MKASGSSGPLVYLEIICDLIFWRYLKPPIAPNKIPVFNSIYTRVTWKVISMAS